LPVAARKLKVPFIVSGGCADGKQLAAALALGAEGMNMGTRFMATVEAPIKDGIKQALVDGDENSTMLVMRTVKNTERVFKNVTAQQVADIEAKSPGKFEAIAPLVKGMNYKRSFQETGNTTDSVWSCGQSMGLIDSIPTCKQLMIDIVGEAESIIRKRLPSMLQAKL
jgi:nitronate monooxygenase